MIGNKANVESKQDEKLLILKMLVLNTILQPTGSVVDIFLFVEPALLRSCSPRDNDDPSF